MSYMNQSWNWVHFSEPEVGILRKICPCNIMG